MIVSLIVGVVVTLVAALNPALRATRVTPMAALREAELQDTKKRGRVVLALRDPARRDRPRDDARSGCSAASTTPGTRGGPARRRRGADPVRRVAVLAAARAAAGVGHRAAARAAARPDRPAGARERDAQARPHRHHGGRADDRARADRVRHGLRRRDQQLDRQDDRRQLPRRDRAPEHRRLLADPARRARRGARRGRRVDRLGDHVRHRRAPEGRREHPARGGGPADARRGARAGLRGGRPGRVRAPGAARHDPRRELRARQGPRAWATRCACARRPSAPRRSACSAPSKGELDLLGKAIIDESATSQFGRLQPNFALARLGVRRRRRRTSRRRWRTR